MDCGSDRRHHLWSFILDNVENLLIYLVVPIKFKKKLFHWIMKQKGQTFSGFILSYVRIFCCQHHYTLNACGSWCMGKAIWRHHVGLAALSSLLHCKNHCVNTLQRVCLHSGPQSYTVGQQWDVLPVKSLQLPLLSPPSAIASVPTTNRGRARLG